MNISTNFTRDELCKCKCGCNTYIKPNIKLVNILEKLRKKVGKPLIINSSYRCPNHPLEKHKRKTGQHTLGNAVDIKIPKGISKKVFLEIILTIKEITGIGLPIDQNYIHIDIRNIPARWAYKNNKQIPYEEGLKGINNEQ